jgi:PPM family protein phosphatase
MFLLCSDGLSTMLEPREIAAILAAGPDPSTTALALVDRANEVGGQDNITVLLIAVQR